MSSRKPLEEHSPSGSINRWILEHWDERKRHGYQAQGLVLFFQRTGMVMVPFRLHDNGDWDCAIVIGHGPYKRGGYHLLVSEGEIEIANECQVVIP